MIRMLLFPENSFIASIFFSKVHLRLWGFHFESHLKSRFCQAAVADPIKYDGPFFDIFAVNIAVINTSMVESGYLLIKQV